MASEGNNLVNRFYGQKLNEKSKILQSARGWQRAKDVINKFSVSSTILIIIILSSSFVQFQPVNNFSSGMG